MRQEGREDKRGRTEPLASHPRKESPRTPSHPSVLQEAALPSSGTHCGTVSERAGLEAVVQHKHDACMSVGYSEIKRPFFEIGVKVTKQKINPFKVHI